MKKIIPSPEALASEKHPCMTCGKLTPIDCLDGKDDGTGNYNILECETCYGPDWQPMRGIEIDTAKQDKRR